MHLAVGPDRRKPRVLKNLAVDGDGIALGQMGSELGKLFAERAQQLAHIAGLQIGFGDTASEVLQRAAEDDVGHEGARPSLSRSSNCVRPLPSPPPLRKGGSAYGGRCRSISFKPPQLSRSPPTPAVATSAGR